jgi:tRNA-dihydrouridine synthase A
MMDWTDRHDRFFLRLVTRHARLYTEMVTTGAVIHGDRDHLLGFDVGEHPVALQLGGNDPDELARAAAVAAAFGYDEINLNVGCPSDRVQSGRFGACLMAEPRLVAEGVAAMRQAVPVPVTVKHRIGIDDRDSYAELTDFVGTVAEAGCRVFVVHARKALLSGLSPRENREVPPLRYDVVHRLKGDFPGLSVIVNGGLQDLDAAQAQLERVDGVMLGRAAYQNPYLLAGVDRRFFGDDRPVRTRHQVVEALIPYVERHLAAGGRLQHVSRHIIGLFQGCPGARAWRRYLSEHAYKDGAGAEVVLAALSQVREPRAA